MLAVQVQQPVLILPTIIPPKPMCLMNKFAATAHFAAQCLLLAGSGSSTGPEHGFSGT